MTDSAVSSKPCSRSSSHSSSGSYTDSNSDTFSEDLAQPATSPLHRVRQLFSRRKSTVSSKRSSSNSSSYTDSGSVDQRPRQQSHLTLRGAAGQFVFTPLALSAETRRWQHAVKAMDAMSDWWKGMDALPCASLQQVQRTVAMAS
jgi:hypothetical protein